MKRSTWFAAVLACVGGCAQANAADDVQDVTASTSADLRVAKSDGAVFTIGNELEGNSVLAFARDKHGALSDAVVYATRGLGSGDSLGSQSALALSEDHDVLVAVNAGSNDVTSFSVDGAKLRFASRVASGGTRPISVSTRDGIVYVLNAGEPANITGFALDRRGRLLPIPRASQPLTGTAVGAAQVEISPDVRQVVVTEKAANAIETFRLTAFGRVEPPVVHASAGTTPFGFEFTRSGYLIVSEAATASASSYALRGRSDLVLRSGVVADTQAAPCWVAVSGDDRWAFVANAGSGSISSYEIDRAGHIELADARGGELEQGGVPLDMALGKSGRYLYVLDRGNRDVTSFSVDRDGTLELLDAVGALPAFATGLAAY